jgi:hypothetical protein
LQESTRYLLYLISYRLSLISYTLSFTVFTPPPPYAVNFTVYRTIDHPGKNAEKGRFAGLNTYISVIFLEKQGINMGASRYRLCPFLYACPVPGERDPEARSASRAVKTRGVFVL